MELKKIDPLSAAKVGGILYAGIGVLIGLLIAVFGAVGIAAEGNEAFPAVFAGAGAVCIVPLVYGVIGAIAFALMSLLYNVVAHFVGGIELTFVKK